MCVLCGCPSCTGDGALVSVKNEFNLDTVSTSGGGRANYKWGNDIRGAQSNGITWSINLAGLNSVAGSTSDDFMNAARDVFDTWAAIAGLDFQFVSQAADIDITIAPLSGSTIGTARTSFNPFDSNSNGLVVISGSDIRMGRDEIWRPDGDDGSFTFFQVLLHEVGHAIGLDHFNVSDSVMHQTANFGARTLGDDDIAGVQNLYGEKRWTDEGERGFFTKVAIGQTAYFKGGDDKVDGTAQDDRFYGGAGNDEIHGAGGRDLIIDTRGDNDLFGGDNNDTIIGGAGRIYAEGNDGNDTLIGGIGNDILHGGSGTDILRGDPGGSFISGDDRLIAGSGNDFLEGGGGSDVFVFNKTDGTNRIAKLDLSDGRQVTGRDFQVGIDNIDLSDFDMEWQDVLDRLTTDRAGNAVFLFDEDQTQFTLIVEDVAHIDLSAGDFIL